MKPILLAIFMAFALSVDVQANIATVGHVKQAEEAKMEVWSECITNVGMTLLYNYIRQENTISPEQMTDLYRTTILEHCGKPPQ